MKKTILIYDDDPIIHKLIEKKLAESYEIVSDFGDGNITNIIKDKNVDILVLDYLLPNTDGVTLLKEVRKSNKEIPVIMFSSKTNDYDKEVCLTSGANVYVEKGPDIFNLINAIKSFS